MSGQAGAGVISEYFQIYFSSGMFVSVAIPPDSENHSSYIADYFKEANKPFETKLNEILPKLDQNFEVLIQEHKLPICEYDSEAEFITDAIIEDVDLDHKNESKENVSKNTRAYISLSFFTRSFSKIDLSITINKQIKRSELNLIRDQIIEIFD